MKNLLIVIAILMLGCGTDTEIVDEPTPIEEELPLVKEEPLPVVEEPPPIPEDHGEPWTPEIIGSNLSLENWLEAGTFDPVTLNQDGIFFDFDTDLTLFKADLSHDGKPMGWLTRSIPPAKGIAFSIKMIRPADGSFLEHDKEYRIDVFVLAKNGEHLELEIRFRTTSKP